MDCYWIEFFYVGCVVVVYVVVECVVFGDGCGDWWCFGVFGEYCGEECVCFG